MPTQHEPLVEPGRLIINIPVPMRDGVNLSADIWLPDSSQGDGPWPTLLLRTIYDNQEPRYIGWARRFTAQGYAVVMEDCRGRGDSEGEWEPYVCELHDGYDTHEWIGRQPWCDGNVGTFGLSYPGFTQTLPASLRSKYLKAVAPIVPAAQYGVAILERPLRQCLRCSEEVNRVCNLFQANELRTCNAGFEPTTSGSGGQRSIQLN